ncbi:ADP-ribosylglycohydrolase family protein [Chlorobium phaeovibrioides]|uniref:ADP-ribosylglycohydrolase n=1 Tax=Chlorobium phaeovibrioides TaxID=1094 RepID=A0ABW9UTI3_CHLPH|nr:ADP-ribosylglycohydrolase family protein [Chlorobium phaeovibrioides]MWV55252.1 hypothetical protein [Chlorobium phaeovibrioides]
MIGAIAGDIIGSVYEHRPIKTKEFPLFHPACRFTDDTVLSVAVAEAILTDCDYQRALLSFGRRYPHAGYGEDFSKWLRSSSPYPYNSWGNGSAMRAVAVGFAFDTEDEVLEEARQSAIVTHNHPQGIKGAQAAALAVLMARKGEQKEVIRMRMMDLFHYDLYRSVDEIRKGYSFDISCPGTVPEAIISALDSTDWEDAVRSAVSLGGDSDTLACIAGAVAEALYGGVPQDIQKRALEMLPTDLKDVLVRFASCSEYPKGRPLLNTELYPDPDSLYNHALSLSYEYAMVRMMEEDLPPVQGDEGSVGRESETGLYWRAVRLFQQFVPAARGWSMDEIAHKPECTGLLEAICEELGSGRDRDSRAFGRKGPAAGLVEYLFLETLSGMLSGDEPNLGGYHEVKLVNGKLKLFTFPEAVRIHWPTREARYGKRFGELPVWVYDLHPQLRIDLVRFSLEISLALPDSLPEFLKGNPPFRQRRPVFPALVAFEAATSGCTGN